MSRQRDQVQEVESSIDGRYTRFDEKLGDGAYKAVWLAYDAETGKEVAWNTVDLRRMPEGEKKRIEGEWKILKTLKHHNIIKFFSVWRNPEKEQICFTTEIVTSGTLKQYTNRLNVKLKVIKKWCRQILTALDYLHSHVPPIIHRDLKCDNIFINGSTGEIRIGDFGLSALRHNTTVASVLGTPEFMAPELYDEVYNEMVDIYAFGMCVLEMVTKEYPYQECINPVQIWKRVSSGTPPLVLARVRDKEVKSFVELCLVESSARLSARELLEHPFLAAPGSDTRDNFPVAVDPLSTEAKAEPSTPRPTAVIPESQLPPAASAKDAGKRVREINVEVTGVKDNVANITLAIKFQQAPVLDDSQSLTESTRTGRKLKEVKFEFDFNQDTADSVAGEMVSALDLPDPKKTATLIAMNIETQIAPHLTAYQKKLSNSRPVSAEPDRPMTAPAVPHHQSAVRPATAPSPPGGHNGHGAKTLLQNLPHTSHTLDSLSKPAVPPSISTSNLESLVSPDVFALPQRVSDATPSSSPSPSPDPVSGVPDPAVRKTNTTLPKLDVSNIGTHPASVSVASSGGSSPRSQPQSAGPSSPKNQALDKVQGKPAAKSVKGLKARCSELGATEKEIGGCFDKRDLQELLKHKQAEADSQALSQLIPRAHSDPVSRLHIDSLSSGDLVASKAPKHDDPADPFFGVGSAEAGLDAAPPSLGGNSPVSKKSQGDKSQGDDDPADPFFGVGSADPDSDAAPPSLGGNSNGTGTNSPSNHSPATPSPTGGAGTGSGENGEVKATAAKEADHGLVKPPDDASDDVKQEYADIMSRMQNYNKKAAQKATKKALTPPRAAEPMLGSVEDLHARKKQGSSAVAQSSVIKKPQPKPKATAASLEDDLMGKVMAGLSTL